LLPDGFYSKSLITDTLPNNVYILKVDTLQKSKPFIKNNLNLGIPKKSSIIQQLKIFPNPTAENLNIEYNGIKRILLSNMNGKMVFKNQTVSNVINLCDISRGTYNLQVFDYRETLIANQKIVKVE